MVKGCGGGLERPRNPILLASVSVLPIVCHEAGAMGEGHVVFVPPATRLFGSSVFFSKMSFSQAHIH